MKIMAVDYGDARTGLAVCDRTEFLASPVGTIEEKSFAKVAEKIVYATREFDVGMVVIGPAEKYGRHRGAARGESRRLAGHAARHYPHSRGIVGRAPDDHCGGKHSF